MASTEILIVMLVATSLAIFAERHHMQAPLVLVLVGLVASFVPGVRVPQLDPETILAIVVPPLLYSAALDFSFFSFMKRIGSILNLSVALVVVTAGVVAWVAVSMMPSLTFAGALLLGAAIAPPDAVSAVSIGREIGLPRRLMTIMKGESLLNDAAALSLFGVAAVLVTGGQEGTGSVAMTFVYASVGGALVGVLLGRVVDKFRRRMDNPTLATTLAILVPFSAYALADRIDTSGVTAVVFAAFTLSHHSSDMGFAGRIQEREVWRVVSSLLEAFAFAFMGLQLRSLVISAHRDGSNMMELAIIAAVLLVVVIVVRFVWIGLTTTLARWRIALYHRIYSERYKSKHAGRVPAEALTWGENLVLSWSGMRGVVTLAAAASTPLVTMSGQPVAGRSAIVLVAFTVAVATLLLQGMTLPWLVRRMHLPRPDAPTLKNHHGHARNVMRSATKESLAKLRAEGTAESAIVFAEGFMARTGRLARETTDEIADNAMPVADRAEMADVVRTILAAQRQALIVERDSQRLDDEVLREVLEGIDLEQALLAQKVAAAKARASL
ncbi:cation:proton antiporter [soil metagenome]